MTIDITKITPEKLAEMNDSLLVDNTHLRDTVANLRKQVATLEQPLARIRNQVRDECEQERDQLRAELVNALAACKAKDELLDEIGALNMRAKLSQYIT